MQSGGWGRTELELRRSLFSIDFIGFAGFSGRLFIVCVSEERPKLVTLVALLVAWVKSLDLRIENASTAHFFDVK